MKKAEVALLAVFCCLAAPPRAPAAALMSSFEEKMRYERSLEQKADELLLKILGPSRARVSVEAAMKIEEAVPQQERPQPSRFAWMEAAQKNEKAKELLPGYRAPVVPEPMNDSEVRAFSLKVSKLTATVIVAGDMTPQKAAEVSDLVGRVIGLDQARGDTLDLVRATFAEPWKTVWYSPEYIGYFVRYGIIAAVIIISFLIIGLGIMRLASAMGSVARAQEHDVSIGFEGGQGGEGALPGGGAPGLPAPAGKDGKKEEPGGGEAEEGRITFAVKPEQVPVLLGMIAKEDPENISLVVYHLPEEVRGQVLSGLGRELASKVVQHLATVRFVEKEMVAELKSELERRLESAVGGIDKAIELISPMRYSDRREPLRQFDASDPALAAEIRRTIIFDDDLLRLDEKGMGQLAMCMPVAQWAEVFPSLQPELQARLKALLPANSVKMLEESLKYADKSPEKLDAALDQFMAKVAGLVKEGRLPRPAPASSAPKLESQPGKKA